MSAATIQRLCWVPYTLCQATADLESVRDTLKQAARDNPGFPRLAAKLERFRQDLLKLTLDIDAGVTDAVQAFERSDGTVIELGDFAS